MSEKIPSVEGQPEHFPSIEDVKKIIEKITQGKEFESVRTGDDEKGLYLWDIKLKEPNELGDIVEYSYMRAGRYPEGSARITAIHMTTFDSEGNPTGGTSVAKFVNGEWVETP